MTLKERLNELGAKEGDVIIFRGARYVFKDDSWFYGWLEGEKTLSPNFISHFELADPDEVTLQRKEMPKISPDKCTHINIHPNRFDGPRTVCMDCETPVMVQTFTYMNGTPTSEQFESLLAKLCDPDNREEKPTKICAGCGEAYPCSDANRTDISGRERAKHFVK
jgi:hypothetical protein